MPLVIMGSASSPLPEIVDLVRRQVDDLARPGPSLGEGWIQGVKDTIGHWWLVVRCSSLGVIIGALPGPRRFGHQLGRLQPRVQTAKDRSQFGKGDVRGVLGPESANNAQDGGALMPTLLFGIPGSGSMALLLGGLHPDRDRARPRRWSRNNLDLTYTIIWSLALGNVFGAGICVFLARPIARLTTVPVDASSRRSCSC